MNTIKSRIKTCLSQIDNHAKAGQTVDLVACSKGHSIIEIEQAAAAGLHQFAENYVQEALPKITALSPQHIEWHFIGPIQSNKCKEIANHFAWVQTIDREKVAQRLNDQRPASLPPLQVLIQLNLEQEKSKSGVTLDELPQLAETVSRLPRLQWRGLMAIPKQHHNPQAQQHVFKQIHHAFTTLKQRYPQLDTLSIGMSGDFQTAIEHGATMVRIGTAIFGPRR